MLTNRSFQGFIIILVAVIIGLAIFFEYDDHLLPCPLCIFQRVAYGLVAVGAFLAWIANKSRWACVIGWLIGLFASCAGIAMAIRQVWLQHLGPQAMKACVPGLGYLYSTFSWFKATMLVFQGTSDCANVTWRFLGLSMAGWSIILFGFFIVIFLVCLFSHKKH